MRLVRLVRWWMREGIPERWQYHYVRKNPWRRARQLDTEGAYWKDRAQDCEGEVQP